MTPVSINELAITPHSIRTYLDQFVVGQETAKDSVASVGFLHYLRFLRTNAGGNPLKHTNIMLMGPSGSGKTLLFKKLAEYLGFPFLNVSALDLSRMGWAGEALSEKISKLVTAPDVPSQLGKFSIIFIDEIDKLGMRAESTNSSDVNSDIQATFLKLLEGDSLPPAGPSKLMAAETAITTHQMLFVFAGAFNKVTAKRQLATKGSIGFIAPEKVQHDAVTLQKEAIEAGLIPELMGRIGTIIELTALTREQLKHVLMDAKGSALKDSQALLEFIGQKLVVKEEDIEQILDDALKNETGARALDVAIQALIIETIKNIGNPANQPLQLEHTV